MNRQMAIKFAQFFLIVLLGVAADQWTKQVASDQLAATSHHPTRGYKHPIKRAVPSAFEGKTAQEFLTSELGGHNSAEEITQIASRWTYTPEGARVLPQHKLKSGQIVEIRERKIVVIPDMWEYEYAENRGAAFSFMADAEGHVRAPFFIVVSIIALLTILYILWGVPLGQQLGVWGLSLIAAGALGNFADRLRLGYVVDFIVWKYTDAHRWPTFNIADVLICVGVGLMLLELLREWWVERRAATAGDQDAPALAEAAEG